MGKRVRATELWVPTTDLPVAPSHPFYRRLNEILRAGDFDAFVERTCQKFYAARMSRPSLAPGMYFRLLRHSHLPLGAGPGSTVLA